MSTTEIREIVINTDYGGFGLSPEGLEAYAKRKGIETLYWFEYNFEKNCLERIDNPAGRYIPIAHTIPNPDKNTASFSNRDIPRDDPDLVAIVKELGKKAEGRYSSLGIIKIPADVEWQIEEYDGIEWVAEKHRIWRAEYE